MRRHFSMSPFLRQDEVLDSTESGFVLVLSLVVLLMLSLFGAWALQTSNFELKVAGGTQQAERQFNIAEGSAYAEAGNLGFNLKDFYQVSDPTLFNRLMIPTTDADFDPGNDTATTLAGITASDATTWPWDNLLRNYDNLPSNTNEFDYRYLVTYLYSDTAPMGYDPTAFSGYKFRIQGNTTQTFSIVELGGTKVGVKAAL